MSAVCPQSRGYKPTIQVFLGEAAWHFRSLQILLFSILVVFTIINICFILEALNKPHTPLLLVTEHFRQDQKYLDCEIAQIGRRDLWLELCGQQDNISRRC